MANCLEFPANSAATDDHPAAEKRALSPRAAVAVWFSGASIGWGLIFLLTAAVV